LHAFFRLFTRAQHARIDCVMRIASGRCRGEPGFGKP
jgi:hypothetical protein